MRLEKFFGLQVKVAKDIQFKKYAATKTKMRQALAGFDFCEGNDFNIYITRIELCVTREKVFKVAGLVERLQKIQIRITVNPRDKELKRIFFLNDELTADKWLLSPDVQAEADKYTIKIVCDGHYCSSKSTVELLIMTCVSKGVPQDARKLKIVVTAYATPEYSRLLTNANGKITTVIPYYLDSRVQFLLPFESGPEIGRNLEPIPSGPRADSSMAGTKS